ncbi:LacI family DNA-binding transcriptional regulator [Coraliomargarita algicola]|uniref:LacI family DNA-binding transcriptional regulator n=1 Tax=Coraliomargarita algicola TaxID=3092156 RepID=A0ABZ0RR20_9BACT|nr:LacI family DNA-binding transcriptional regulator [Coraliomargarita sp. J2-16]WPJ97235.1 LacI family DNA-binding transcriptional regulator [Coraliomargarita sp. J2-16]
MKPKPNTTTMQDIADACDVSKMTVSLALRNDPRVKVSTREQIQSKAAQLGYTTNPYVATLMKQLRKGAKRGSPPVIAFLNLHKKPSSYHTSGTFEEYFQGAKQRAEEIGFRLEEFQLHGKDMSIPRLEKILYARNIHSILICPSDHSNTHLDFQWERYAMAKFGFSVSHPAANYVTSDHFQCMELALNNLAQRGYKKIGFALKQSMDERVNHRWIGAFLSTKWRLGRANQLKLCVPADWNKENFLQWFIKERPEVVVSFYNDIPKWLNEAGFRIPEDVGYAIIDWTQDYTDLSGVDQQSWLIGQKAVDLVVERVHHNEWGIPEEAKCVLVEGKWHEGKTLLPIQQSH